MTRKILMLDIEAFPATALVWQAYDVNISPVQVISQPGILCVAAKWAGEPAKNTEFFALWTGGRKRMLKSIHSMMSEADAIVTYNGDKFDLPRLKGAFLLEGLPPAPPVVSIDLYKAVKKFGFLINKLEAVGPLLKIGEKVKNAGFQLWKDVMDGVPSAQEAMRKYNIQDVVLLEKLYNRVLPFIHNHPHLGEAKQECGSCGSNKTRRRGHRRTKTFKIERLQCQDCGAWSDGKRIKVG